MIAKKILQCVFALVLAGTVTNCGDDANSDEKRTGCCRIKAICNKCICSTSWEKIGNQSNENACDELLKDPDVADGCPAFDGGDAILACK